MSFGCKTTIVGQQSHLNHLETTSDKEKTIRNIVISLSVYNLTSIIVNQHCKFLRKNNNIITVFQSYIKLTKQMILIDWFQHESGKSVQVRSNGSKALFVQVWILTGDQFYSIGLLGSSCGKARHNGKQEVKKISSCWQFLISWGIIANGEHLVLTDEYSTSWQWEQNEFKKFTNIIFGFEQMLNRLETLKVDHHIKKYCLSQTGTYNLIKQVWRWYILTHIGFWAYRWIHKIFQSAF